MNIQIFGSSKSFDYEEGGALVQGAPYQVSVYRRSLKGIIPPGVPIRQAESWL